MVRLNKLMAERGIGARRKCDELIEAGAVRVNGEVVVTLGVKVDPDKDRVMVSGKPLPGPVRSRYFALYKPVGVITTLDDPEGRPTIRQLLPPGLRLYPVGRLDADTSGLLLVTNDGDLAHRLMHPRYGVEKLYRVLVTSHPNPSQVARLSRGVMYEPGVRSAPARVRVRDRIARGHVLEIAIHEGRYRQVRRMCEAVDLEVVALHRWGYGPLRLGELERGMWRELSTEEVRLLRIACSGPGTAAAPRERAGRPRRVLAGGIGFAALRRGERPGAARGPEPSRPAVGPRRPQPGAEVRRPERAVRPTASPGARRPRPERGAVRPAGRDAGRPARAPGRAARPGPSERARPRFRDDARPARPARAGGVRPETLRGHGSARPARGGGAPAETSRPRDDARPARARRPEAPESRAPKRQGGRPRPIDWRHGGSPMSPEPPARRASRQRPGTGRNPRPRGGESAGPGASPRGARAAARRGPGRGASRQGGGGRPRR